MPQVTNHKLKFACTGKSKKKSYAFKNTASAAVTGWYNSQKGVCIQKLPLINISRCQPVEKRVTEIPKKTYWHRILH
jgi:hypothetical protein